MPSSSIQITVMHEFIWPTRATWPLFRRIKIFQANKSLTIIIFVADVISVASFTSENEETVVLTTQFPRQNLKTSYFGRKTNGSLLITDTTDEMDPVDRTIMEWIDTLYRMVFNKNIH